MGHFGQRLCELVQPWSACRADDTAVCGEELTECRYAMVLQRLQGLRTGCWFRLASTVVRRRKDDSAWWVSDDVPSRPGFKLHHTGKRGPRQHARRFVWRG